MGAGPHLGVVRVHDVDERACGDSDRCSCAGVLRVRRSICGWLVNPRAELSRRGHRNDAAGRGDQSPST